MNWKRLEAGTYELDLGDSDPDDIISPSIGAHHVGEDYRRREVDTAVTNIMPLIIERPSSEGRLRDCTLHTHATIAAALRVLRDERAIFWKRGRWVVAN
jgi:hypothetical protein